MEIKKKGKKWVAVDEYGVEYTHYCESKRMYAKIVGELGGVLRHITLTTYSAQGITASSKSWFDTNYKPIEPPAPFWHKYKADTPVLVRNSNAGYWNKRYFCEVVGGKPLTFNNGATSWSSETRTIWEQIKDVETGEVWKAN